MSNNIDSDKGYKGSGFDGNRSPNIMKVFNFFKKYNPAGNMVNFPILAYIDITEPT